MTEAWVVVFISSKLRSRNGGTMRRIACGRMIRFMSWGSVIPSALPPSHWLRSMETIPARYTSAMNAPV